MWYPVGTKWGVYRIPTVGNHILQTPHFLVAFGTRNEVLMAVETVALSLISHVLSWYTGEEDDEMGLAVNKGVDELCVAV